jgi:hypothetical protein
MHCNSYWRGLAYAAVALARKASLAVGVAAGVSGWPSDVLGQADTSPFDSQHCPPIACSASTTVLPEGCHCISDEVNVVCKNVQIKDKDGIEHSEERCHEVIKGAPPPLPAPEGCDPDAVKQQLGTALGTIKFIVAPASCGITADQCQAIPNRQVELLKDGTLVCMPLICRKECYRFGNHVDSKLPLVGRFSGVEFCSTCVAMPVAFRNSVDPNDKTGPAGAGDMRFVRGDSPLSYTIHFENLATATGAAQNIVVSDQVDVQRVDVDTFRLGPIAFGDQAFLPAPGARGWTGSVDLTQAQNVLVAITAGMDRATGLVTWRFTALDPASQQVTDDADAGFLPPNTNPPAGEGSVTFTVMPKAGLATGTQIQNGATVVFDTNAPIPTPTWTNVIDRDPPATRVLPLAATQAAPTFDVQWRGTDAGSGIDAFALLVSDNSGPFQVWIDRTNATSATYTGQVGHTYGFVSVGTDAVGNVEVVKTAADASTTVGAISACAQDVTRSVAITRSGYGYNFATRRFVQTVTLRNATAHAIAGPLALALDSLTNGVTLYNPAGATGCALPAGSPYGAINADLPAGGTLSFSLQFINPSQVGITYSARVLAGTPR